LLQTSKVTTQNKLKLPQLNADYMYAINTSGIVLFRLCLFVATLMMILSTNVMKLPKYTGNGSRIMPSTL